MFSEILFYLWLDLFPLKINLFSQSHVFASLKGDKNSNSSISQKVFADFLKYVSAIYQVCGFAYFTRSHYSSLSVLRQIITFGFGAHQAECEMVWPTFAKLKKKDTQRNFLVTNGQHQTYTLKKAVLNTVFLTHFFLPLHTLTFIRCVPTSSTFCIIVYLKRISLEIYQLFSNFLILF